MKKTQQIKIHFPLVIDEDNFPPISVETLNGVYKSEGIVTLDNTPFFVTGIALGDKIKCKKKKYEQGYWYYEIKSKSGNKALSIIFLKDGYEEEIYQYLRKRGCYCEYGEFDGFNMLAVCVFKDQEYSKIASYLDELEDTNLLSYAELCI